MYPTMTCFGKAWSRNVTTNVFVLLLPPELSLTEMFSMLTTPCDFISARTSSFWQFARVWCGLAVTGQPARLFSLVNAELCVAEEISMRISPCRKHRTVLTVPMEHFKALLITNGESFDAALFGSALNYEPPIVMTTGSLFTIIIIHVY